MSCFVHNSKILRSPSQNRNQIKSLKAHRHADSVNPSREVCMQLLRNHHKRGWSEESAGGNRGSYCRASSYSNAEGDSALVTLKPSSATGRRLLCQQSEPLILLGPTRAHGPSYTHLVTHCRDACSVSVTPADWDLTFPWHRHLGGVYSRRSGVWLSRETKQALSVKGGSWWLHK